MKKFFWFALLLLCAATGRSQIVGGPIFGCTGAINTGSVWNSGTSASTTQAILNSAPVYAVMVQLDTSSGTFSAGAITFQGTYDGVNWVSVPAAQVLNPNSAFAQIANPYTLTTSTNQPFLILLQGFASIRLDLSTAITGTGTVTPYYNSNCNVLVASANQLGTWTVQPGNTQNATPWLVSSDPCQVSSKSSANINITASGQIVTGTSSKQTWICSIDILTATAQNIALVEGTGTTCGTSTAGMAGGTTAAAGWNFAANGGLTKGAGAGTVFRTATVADNVCLLLSGSGQTSGSIQYVQQ